MSQTQNIDQREVEKFNDETAKWWDKHGPSKPLHDINPMRLDFITQHCALKQKKICDVGCGGGILSESLAHAGASVNAIDANESALDTARQHAKLTNLDIHYQHTTVEKFAEQNAELFDVVTCLELLEHVPDPRSVLQACTKLLKPGGDLFLSTLNRNLKAYLFAVIGAEYLLNLLPRGTHDYNKFLKPAELADWAQSYGLSVASMRGMTYNPITRKYSLTDNVDVNYLMHLKKAC